MNTQNSVLSSFALIICSLSGGAAAGTGSSLQVSVVEFVSPSTPDGESTDKKLVEHSFSHSYPVRFSNSEVQVLLGDFGWEGIRWSQLPTNALAAALKRYPNATKIRLFWNKYESMGGHWNDTRDTVLFVKPQGKIRFFTRGQSYYSEKIHPSTEFMELRKVTPSMIHEIAGASIPKRRGSFAELLLARGASLTAGLNE